MSDSLSCDHGLYDCHDCSHWPPVYRRAGCKQCDNHIEKYIKRDTCPTCKGSGTIPAPDKSNIRKV